MQLIKRLTQTLSAGSTSLTFTDSMINNNSVIEVYADSIEVYPTALSQSGTSVTVQFDEQQAAHSILLLINNIVSLSDPTLATLLDVDLSTLSDDDILTYDETAEKWVNEGARTAEDIAYDNTDSGLTATDVQAAIDELAQSGSGDAPEQLNISDFMTMRTGYTVAAQSRIIKQGKRVSGMLCIKSTSNFTGTSVTVADINSAYVPTVALLPICVVGYDEWSSRAVGYCFMSTALLIASESSTGNKAAKIQFDYLIP